MRPHPASAGLFARLLSAKEAARYLGISPTNFRSRVAAGELPRPKRLGGRLLWDIVDLEAFCDALPYDGPANGHDADGDSFADWAS